LESLELFNLIGVALPVTAATDVELNFAGSWPDRTTWQVSGDATLTEHEPVSGMLAVAGNATFSIESGFLTVEAPAVHLSGAEFKLRLDDDLAGRVDSPDGKISLAGVTRDSADTQRGVLTILEMMDIPPPEIMATILSGSGRLEAEIGLGETTAFDLNLGLDDGAWGGDRFNLMEFRM
jgi:hypothetical protein